MKKTVIVTNAGYPTLVIKIDERRSKYIKNKIKTAYNNYYGDEKLHDEYRGFHNFIKAILNRFNCVEFLEFSTIEVDPHW